VKVQRTASIEFHSASKTGTRIDVVLLGSKPRETQKAINVQISFVFMEPLIGFENRCPMPANSPNLRQESAKAERNRIASAWFKLEMRLGLTVMRHAVSGA